MSNYTLASLPDHVVAQRVDTHAVQQRTDAPLFIAELAEFDARKLWAPAGYHSTHDYGVRKHRLDHYLTCRWIAIARLGYRYPVIFPALAEGKLSQTTILLLKPYLTSHIAPALLKSAMGKSKRQVEQLLAAKFPRPDVPTSIQPWMPPLAMSEPAPSAPEGLTPPATLSNKLVAPAHMVPSFAPAQTVPMEPLAPRAKVAALSPDRNALQVTIDDECVELLDHARDLLSHALPNADAGAAVPRARDGASEVRKDREPARCEGRGRE